MKKKGVITAVIILFICVAVYLNLQMPGVESDGDRISENLSKDANSTDAVSVSESESSIASEEKEVEDPKEYFDEARIEKQKARDSAITTLKEAVSEEKLSQESRDSAAESIETISTGAISETRIETLVKAKGFKDCVALINNECVSVIVTAPEGGLTNGDITKIKDIAVGETEFLPSQIKVIEIK